MKERLFLICVLGVLFVANAADVSQEILNLGGECSPSCKEKKDGDVFGDTSGFSFIMKTETIDGTRYLKKGFTPIMRMRKAVIGRYYNSDDDNNAFPVYSVALKECYCIYSKTKKDFVLKGAFSLKNHKVLESMLADPDVMEFEEQLRKGSQGEVISVEETDRGIECTFFIPEKSRSNGKCTDGQLYTYNFYQGKFFWVKTTNYVKSAYGQPS